MNNISAAFPDEFGKVGRKIYNQSRRFQTPDQH
jgi:hypothetical protein